MGRATKTVGKPDKKRSTRGADAKSRSAPKAERGRGSSVANRESKVTRLTMELEEALQRQAATADILKVIAGSRTNIQPVLDAIVKAAVRFCGAEDAVIGLREDDEAVVGAHAGPIQHDVGRRVPLDRTSAAGRAILDGRTMLVPDLLAPEAAELTMGQKLAREFGFRAVVAVPMMSEREAIGTLFLRKTQPGAFTPQQIDLLQTFAAQAVIAVENVRLFSEVKAKTVDLARSVDELTATGDVLKIISRSSVDLETVLDRLVETVARLCRADQAAMFRRRDKMYQLVTVRGLSEEAQAFVRAHPFAHDRRTVTGRAVSERRAIHIPDVAQDPEYSYEGAKLVGYRTVLGIPLLREDALVGVFFVARTRVDPFTAKEIELATSFSDQAVIAIENARLFDELRERQAELRVTFDNMGDGVAMFGADTRLVAWNRNFQTILDAQRVGRTTPDLCRLCPHPC